MYGNEHQGKKIKKITVMSTGLNSTAFASTFYFLFSALTYSIENVVSGDSFPTDITLISSADLKTITKKKG